MMYMTSNIGSIAAESMRPFKFLSFQLNTNLTCYNMHMLQTSHELQYQILAK